MSISNNLEEAWLKTIQGGSSGTTFSPPSSIWVKLHTADPGEDGTNAAANNTVRQEVVFNSPVNPGGTMASSANLTWATVSNTETYAAISLWDNNSTGNCLWTGVLAGSKAVTAGDTFTIQAGQLTLTLG